VRLLAKIHHQVAGLLGGPFSGGMQGDADDADAPGCALDYGRPGGEVLQRAQLEFQGRMPGLDDRVAQRRAR
jgi:hypothetical protein